MTRKDESQIITRLRKRRRMLRALIDRQEALARAVEAEEAFDLAERGSHISELRLIDRLLDHGRRELAEVEEALARVSSHRTEECASCGRPIRLRRLQALPEATTCRRCAEDAERAAVWRRAVAHPTTMAVGGGQGSR